MDTDSYDAAGNLLSDGSHTYTYDAENRIIGVGGSATASYAYDAEGRRVSTTVAGVTRLRFFDERGHTVRRIDPSGQWLSSEIYALGQPLATYDQSGATGMTWFMDVDPVGTIRTITNGSGQYAQACTSLPFGDDQSCTPAISDPSPLHFTGKPRDAETGLDAFPFRYNNSSLGRFMTPDPAGNLVASPANPQSWNQYAYVRNNPVTLVDPFGLDGTNPTLCSTSAGMVFCNATVNGAANGGIINPGWAPTALGSIIGDIGTGPAPSGGGGGGGALANWDANRPSCVGQFVRNSASGIKDWFRQKAQSFSLDAAGLLNPSDPELWGPQVGAGLAAVAQAVSTSGMIGRTVLAGGVVGTGTLNVTSGSLSALAAITSEAAAWIDAGKVAAVAAGDTALAAVGASVSSAAAAGSGAIAAGYAFVSVTRSAHGGGCTGDKLW